MKGIKKAFLVLMLALFTMLSGACAMGEESTEVSLLAINVGKADALLLTVGQQHFLIDTGTEQSWGALYSALESRQITHLDGVFLTHTDKDHAGGLVTLAKSNIAVDAWYASEIYYEKSVVEHQMVQAADVREEKVTWLSAGTVLRLWEKNATITVLGPVTQNIEDENNNSLVLRVDTDQGSMLLMGDCEDDEEWSLMRMGLFHSCDLLKVAHHGRDDATSAAMLSLVKPKTAIISTDKMEDERTADINVINRLETEGTQVFLTQDADVGILAELQNDEVIVTPINREDTEVCFNVRLTDFDYLDEQVRLVNDGDTEIDLSGWYLFSENDGEMYFFPEGTLLSAKGSILVTTYSGTAAGDLTWPDSNVWGNKKLDTAELYNQFGILIDKVDNGLPE